MKKIFCSLLATILILPLFSSCGVKGSYRTEVFSAMDTAISIVLYDDFGVSTEDEKFNNCVTEIKKIITEIENSVSISLPSSDVYRFNHGETVMMTDVTKELLEKSLYYYELTNGLFNPAIYPIEEFWGFYDEEPQYPSGSISDLSFNTDFKCINYTDFLLTPNNGIKIDLGGIAKGYATDKIKDILDKYEYDYGYVSIGSSSIYIIDLINPNATLSIKNPRNDGTFLSIKASSVKGKFISTSGDYEKYYIYEDQRYCHIIDPETLYPINNGIMSATVICDSGIYADVLSTALCLGLNPADDYRYYVTHNYDGNYKVITNDTEDLYTITDTYFSI